MTLTFLIGLKQPDRLATDVHEVDVAERVPVTGLDSVHLRTRTRRSACVLCPSTPALCQVLNLGRGGTAPHDQRQPRKGAKSWTQFAKVVAFLRLAAQRPEPLVAKARSRLRPPLISPNRSQPPLDPSRPSPPLDACTLSYVPIASCLASCPPTGGRRHLRPAAAAARPRRAAARADAPRRRAPGRRSLRVLLVDAAGHTL